MSILEQLSQTEGKDVADIAKAMGIAPEYVWRDLLSLAYHGQCWCDGRGQWRKINPEEGAQK